MNNNYFPLSNKEAEKAGVLNQFIDNRNTGFPTRLRELREKANISQQKLANEIGVTKSTIGLYENGENVPDVKTLYNLAKYYNVSADYLLALSDVKTTDTDLKAVCEFTGLSESAIRTLRDNDDFNLYMPILDYFINIENVSNSDDSLCLFSNICMFVFNLAKNNNHYYYDHGEFVKTDDKGDMPVSFTTQEILDRICIDKITEALFKGRKVLKKQYDSIIRGDFNA